MRRIFAFASMTRWRETWCRCPALLNVLLKGIENFLSWHPSPTLFSDLGTFVRDIALIYNAWKLEDKSSFIGILRHVADKYKHFMFKTCTLAWRTGKLWPPPSQFLCVRLSFLNKCVIMYPAYLPAGPWWPLRDSTGKPCGWSTGIGKLWQETKLYNNKLHVLFCEIFILKNRYGI